ncbi:MAG: EFR1 family ferrodoxin [Erysipelotrichaceae bacterium]
MKIEGIKSIVFSPTDSTMKVMKLIHKQLPLSLELIDITLKRDEVINVEENELCLIGVPVYGGRIPSPVADYFTKIKGNHTPIVLVATYGNRDYDDALLELNDLAIQQGFVVVGAAAFICEHSIMHSVGKGRIDAADETKIIAFAKQVYDKIIALHSIDQCGVLSIKGNRPYKQYSGIPLKPHANKTCTNCGICASNCPVSAIDKENGQVSDKQLCISCMRCMKVCPIQARTLNKVMLSVSEKAFANKCKIRKEPEIFI